MASGGRVPASPDGLTDGPSFAGTPPAGTPEFIRFMREARSSASIVAELRDVAAWIERTKPQGLLYESALPNMREAADRIERLEKRDENAGALLSASDALFKSVVAEREHYKSLCAAGCTCHPDFSSQGSPLEGPCEFCSLAKPPAESSAGQPSEASTAALATDEPNTSSRLHGIKKEEGE